MLADAEEQLGGGLIVEIGEIGSVEGGVCREVLREVEAEGNLALKPGLHCVAVGGDDLRGGVCGECGDVEIADFGGGGGVDGGVLPRAALDEEQTCKD